MMLDQMRNKNKSFHLLQNKKRKKEEKEETNR